jgi:aminobenzoyl-glutamate utilization protein B
MPATAPLCTNITGLRSELARPGEREEPQVQNSEKIWQLVDARKDAYEALSDRVWGMPEIAYTEYRSAAEHRAMLEREGFRITENVAGIPTAVMGEAGDGGPVIAILGEYDALPGLSQVAGIAEPKGTRRTSDFLRRQGCWHSPEEND